MSTHPRILNVAQRIQLLSDSGYSNREIAFFVTLQWATSETSQSARRSLTLSEELQTIADTYKQIKANVDQMMFFSKRGDVIETDSKWPEGS